jgi:hypothetical protein
MKCGLVSGVERLIETQSIAWPLLTRGIEGLHNSQTRRVQIEWYEVLVRHIPHRIGSTTAAVDPISVQKRPCFLCRANLPPEERGLPLDTEFTAYCNPFPILDRHLTIVHNDHRPQAIGGHGRSLLRLAENLPGYFLIYNGPECGASAPDHLHFQACSRAVFPIEKHAQGIQGLTIPDYGRRVFLLRDADPVKLSARLEKLVSILANETLATLRDAEPREPMLNIAAYYDAPQWTVFVFPRGKHRPRVYETGELTVSPATIDLCGVFVVPLLKDFERITGPDIERIFEEVTLSMDIFNRVLAQLEQAK